MSHLPEHLQSLLQSSTYDHSVSQFELLETHISWIVLTGEYAYKIKKPVDLGFVDYRKLDDRRRFCHHEFELNRRLAPDLYLSVVAFGPASDSTDWNVVELADANAKPDQLNEVIDFAVKMKQFDQDQLLAEHISDREVSSKQIEQFADRLAHFHARCESADKGSTFGSSRQVATDLQEALDTIEPLCQNVSDISEKFAAITRWCQQAEARLENHFATRKADGMIKACHGDLHCGNMVVIDQQIVAFDGIEFNESFRWIDTMNDLAFAWMDLADRGAKPLANRLLNRYLETSGDYQGLPAWKLFVVYRALVRAKVASLRRDQLRKDHQLGEEDQAELEKQIAAAEQEGKHYIELAYAVIHESEPWLMLTSGVSGSGKSIFASTYANQSGAVCVRSDIERKRAHQNGGPLDQDSLPRLSNDDYSPEASRRLYDSLLDTAQLILRSELAVIVDATFLRKQQREAFIRLATDENRRFCLVELTLDPKEANQRLADRQASGDRVSDADAEVLAAQLKKADPFDRKELSAPVNADGSETRIEQGSDWLSALNLSSAEQAKVAEAMIAINDPQANQLYLSLRNSSGTSIDDLAKIAGAIFQASLRSL